MNKMTNTQHYTYSDQDDDITRTLINQKEPYKGYWQDSENAVLSTMHKHINNYTRNMDTCLLDAGCGEGRLIGIFEKKFSEIWAIEPDPERINLAQDSLKKQKFSDKVTFKNIAIEQLSNEKLFDVILCSHVLQHIHTDLANTTIQKFASILKKNGLLLLTTCHSTKGADYYIKNFTDKYKSYEQLIGKEDFNALTSTGDGLPIHFFSYKAITDCLKNAGFKIIDFRVFHVLEDILLINKSLSRDKIINIIPFLQQRYGRDMLIVAKLDE